jgi:hypothetical protein
LSLQGDLVGATTGAAATTPLGTTQLVGPDGGSVQHLEVMSADLGNVPAGFVNNFAYGTLALASGNSVQLVDDANNSGGAGHDALYVASLVVPSGTTLDLNGLHAYARSTQING